MRAAAGLFVTGTDTGVGKTHCAVLLTRALASRGLRVAVMKPVAAGAAPTTEGLRNEDALALMEAASVAADYATVNPYCLPAPVSPHLAAAACGIEITLAPILQAYARLARAADLVIVEGAGGWLAPLAPRLTIADLARALALPVVLVVGLRLGCLNHAALSAEAIRACGLPLAGWIGNAIDVEFALPQENLATLARLLGTEPLCVLPWRRAEAPPRGRPSEITDAALERLLEAAHTTARTSAVLRRAKPE